MQWCVSVKCKLWNILMPWLRKSLFFSIMLYFRGASLSALLKNSMGCSCPFIFFCSRTTTTVCSDAKEKMKKYLVKSRLIRTCFWVRACFTKSKDWFFSMVHFTHVSLLTMLVMFLRSSASFGMNLLKKLIFLMKYCSSLMFLGWLICNIPSILFGSILIPSLDMMWPKVVLHEGQIDFSWDLKTNHIFYIFERLFLSELGVLHQFLSRLFVIKVNHNELTYFFWESDIHGSLKGGTCIH